MGGTPMRILFSSNKNSRFITITEYIERALDQEYEFHFFDDRSFLIPGKIRNKISSLHKFDLIRLNKNLLAVLQKFKPDIFLEVGGHRILPQTVEKIKGQGVKTILWTIDAPVDFDPIIKTASCYDFVFTGGTEAYNLLKPYNLKNLRWLPFGFDPSYAKPVNIDDNKMATHKNDIVFVGSHYPNRMRILEAISDFDLGVWGPGWEKTPATSPLKKCIKKAGEVSTEEWRQLFSCCKIVIAIHYQNDKIICFQASPKVYEALACKAFLLCDDQKDVTTLFVKGKHLDIFKDTQELREKIQHYLSHPDECKGIAEAGYQEVLQKHTYSHRIKEMMQIIKENS